MAETIPAPRPYLAVTAPLDDALVLTTPSAPVVIAAAPANAVAAGTHSRRKLWVALTLIVTGIYFALLFILTPKS